MVVITDTLEKKPWDFSFYNLKQISKPLKTGDYTLEGYEDILTIERKATTGEIAGNFGHLKRQFYAELDRMKQFKYKYLILEFEQDTVLEFPKNSGIPTNRHYRLQINGKYLMKCLGNVKDTFDVNVIFAGNRQDAISIAVDIFLEVTGDKPVPIF